MSFRQDIENGKYISRLEGEIERLNAKNSLLKVSNLRMKAEIMRLKGRNKSLIKQSCNTFAERSSK